MIIHINQRGSRTQRRTSSAGHAARSSASRLTPCAACDAHSAHESWSCQNRRSTCSAPTLAAQGLHRQAANPCIVSATRYARAASRPAAAAAPPQILPAQDFCFPQLQAAQLRPLRGAAGIPKHIRVDGQFELYVEREG